MESEKNAATLIDTLSGTDFCNVSTANLQFSSFYIVPDKDCDIAFETL